MLTEHDWVCERIKLYKLMKEHPDWGCRRLANALQHDIKWVAKWRKRFLALRTAPKLEDFASESRRPKHCPQRPSPAAQAVILDLRLRLSQQFHRKAGAKTIQYGIREYLKQHPEAPSLPKSRSAIYRILHEMGYLLPRRKPLHIPVVLPPPMEEWEMDFGEIFLPDEGVVFEFFIVVDRGTSRVVYLEATTGYNAETALLAVLSLFEQCGLPKCIRFDRDPRLWGTWTRDSYPAALVRLLRVLGVEDVICPPRRPDYKGFVERCIETLKLEWFAYHAPTTLAEAFDCLARFTNYYHQERPHQGQACQNVPPEEAFPSASLPTLPTLPSQVNPDAWVASVQGRRYRRRINADGTIQVDRHTYRIGTDYKRQAVVAQVVGTELHIQCQDKMIKCLPLQGLYQQVLPFEQYVALLRQEARTIAWHYQSQWMKRSESA